MTKQLIELIKETVNFTSIAKYEEDIIGGKVDCQYLESGLLCENVLNALINSKNAVVIDRDETTNSSLGIETTKMMFIGSYLIEIEQQRYSIYCKVTSELANDTKQTTTIAGFVVKRM